MTKQETIIHLLELALKVVNNPNSTTDPNGMKMRVYDNSVITLTDDEATKLYYASNLSHRTLINDLINNDDYITCLEADIISIIASGLNSKRELSSLVKESDDKYSIK